MDKTRIFFSLGLSILILSTFPMFFDIYRTAAFKTVPFDDYAPYLLTLIGLEDKVPGSPFAYRIFSVAVAIPFYYVLPIYTFTNLSDINANYIRATQALSFSSYLSIIITSFIIYIISRKIIHATRASSVITGLMTFFLSNFITKVAIDPFAILIISLLLLWLNKTLLFASLILVSIGINEKIPIIFTTILTFRLFYSIIEQRKFNHCVQLCFSYLSVAGYFIVKIILKVPGNEAQTEPTMFLANLQSSIAYTLSLKGLFINALPVVVLSLLVVFAVKSRQQSSFHVSDVSGMLVLLILALVANVVYNVGRVTMYSYPLYLPAAACFIDDALRLNRKS